VVLDSPNRENEGDLIIAGSALTPQKMSFMIRHTSGLICAPLAPSLCDQLELPQMVISNQDPNRTAYTISIDANHPTTTTGISAVDRALTCNILAKEDAKPENFRRPGHIFPLRARAGGVRQRPGHTEAAVEFCRLAGMKQAAAISELVEDGIEIQGQAIRGEVGMMRTDGCLAFGKRWGLKVCTIEQLVKYVEKREGPLVVNGSK
jgi:3,4-dihydroxy 2-butanone 4-phosphate synthase